MFEIERGPLDEAKARLDDIITELKSDDNNAQLCQELREVWIKINEAIWTF